MQFCIECGSEIRDSISWCPQCGTLQPQQGQNTKNIICLSAGIESTPNLALNDLLIQLYEFYISCNLLQTHYFNIKSRFLYNTNQALVSSNEAMLTNLENDFQKFKGYQLTYYNTSLDYSPRDSFAKSSTTECIYRLLLWTKLIFKTSCHLFKNTNPFFKLHNNNSDIYTIEYEKILEALDNLLIDFSRRPIKITDSLYHIENLYFSMSRLTLRLSKNVKKSIM